MKTTFKIWAAFAVKPALRFISTDVADLRHLGRLITGRAFHVLREEHLNEFSAHFSEVNIVIRHDWSTELVFHWKDGKVDDQVLSAIRLAINEDIDEETTDV